MFGVFIVANFWNGILAIRRGTKFQVGKFPMPWFDNITKVYIVSDTTEHQVRSYSLMIKTHTSDAMCPPRQTALADLL